jgi:dTDP-4-amino-4,6-dideoxygalactose transaminase
MYARKRLDIGWSDLAAGAVRAVWSAPAESLAHDIESRLSADGREAVAFLSLRSGFDLMLRELALPKGSEVIVSALTIPDMWTLLEHHGLRVIPVDVDPATLAPTAADIERLVTPATRAVLVAHLFGTRSGLDDIVRVAREHRLLLWEDCAQTFDSPTPHGDARADCSMLSFGPIKTATALGGGALLFRDAALATKCRTAHAAYPRACSKAFLKRVLKYVGLKFISLPLPYACFVRWCRWRGRDYDAVIQASVRGFARDELLKRLRHQPSRGLLALMLRRIAGADGARVRSRKAAGDELMHALMQSRDGVREVPGSAAPYHDHWVFTVLTDEPTALIERLRAAGFDATSTATMRSVPAPGDRADLAPRAAERMLARLVYVPMYPELPAYARTRLVEALQNG